MSSSLTPASAVSTVPASSPPTQQQFAILKGHELLSNLAVLPLGIVHESATFSVHKQGVIVGVYGPGGNLDLNLTPTAPGRPALSGKILGKLGELPVIGLLDHRGGEELGRPAILKDGSFYLTYGDLQVMRYEPGGKVEYFELREKFPRIGRDFPFLASDGKFLYLGTDNAIGVRTFDKQLNLQRNPFLIFGSDSFYLSTTSGLHVLTGDEQKFTIHDVQDGKIVKAVEYPARKEDSTELGFVWDHQLLKDGDKDFYVVKPNGHLYKADGGLLSLINSKSGYGRNGPEFRRQVNAISDGIFAGVRQGTIKIWRGNENLGQIKAHCRVEELDLSGKKLTFLLEDSTICQADLNVG